MKFLLPILLTLSSIVIGQTTALNEWNEFVDDESGFSVSVPCEPTKTTFTVSEKPKLARNFIFECKTEKFRFAILISESFRDFDRSEAEAAIIGWEISRERKAEGKAFIEFERSQFQTYGASLANLKSDFALQRELHVVHSKASYTVLVSFRSTNSSGISDDETRKFGFAASRYFDSLVIK